MARVSIAPALRTGMAHRLERGGFPAFPRSSFPPLRTVMPSRNHQPSAGQSFTRMRFHAFLCPRPSGAMKSFFPATSNTSPTAGDRYFHERIWPACARLALVKWTLLGRDHEVCRRLAGDPRIQFTGPVAMPSRDGLGSPRRGSPARRKRNAQSKSLRHGLPDSRCIHVNRRRGSPRLSRQGPSDRGQPRISSRQYLPYWNRRPSEPPFPATAA